MVNDKLFLWVTNVARPSWLSSNAILLRFRPPPNIHVCSSYQFFKRYSRLHSFSFSEKIVSNYDNAKDLYFSFGSRNETQLQEWCVSIIENNFDSPASLENDFSFWSYFTFILIDRFICHKQSEVLIPNKFFIALIWLDSLSVKGKDGHNVLKAEGMYVSKHLTDSVLVLPFPPVPARTKK